MDSVWKDEHGCCYAALCRGTATGVDIVYVQCNNIKKHDNLSQFLLFMYMYDDKETHIPCILSNKKLALLYLCSNCL